MTNRNEKYKIAIVDDELHARDIIKKYLQQITSISFVSVEANNGLDAIELILKEKPDILFLDIQMPELNGFEVLENIKDEAIQTALIFTTAYDNFAIKAFEINAVDYLLKPFDFGRFNMAFERAIGTLEIKTKHNTEFNKLVDYWLTNKQLQEPAEATRILVKENKKAFFVKTTDVVYAEAANYYCVIHTKEGKKHLLTMTLGELERKLDVNCFARIHRSHIVNLDFIKVLLPHFNGEYIVVLNNGIELKLSRNYKENLSKLLL